MAFKESLRSARSARHLTVVQLANAAGVAESSIRNWEHGRCTPRPEQRLRLAAALAVEEGDLTDSHYPGRPASSVQADPVLGEIKERAGAINEQFALIGELLQNVDDPALTTKLCQAQQTFMAFTIALVRAPVSASAGPWRGG